MNKETLRWLVLLGAMAILAYFGYNWLHFKQLYIFIAMILMLPVLILVALRLIERRERRNT
ncbi:hypothetical protein ACFLZM_04335 [Thermodesulfobacteriota bacterium]